MRTTRFRNALTTGVISLLLSGTAVAMCAMPRIVIAPRSGSTLPENPSLFLFAPGHVQSLLVTVSDEDGERPFELTRLSVGRTLTTYRIDIDAPLGSQLSVSARDPRWDWAIKDATYEVGAAVSTRATISIVDIEQEHNSWTCSYQKSHQRELVALGAGVSNRVGGDGGSVRRWEDGFARRSCFDGQLLARKRALAGSRSGSRAWPRELLRPHHLLGCQRSPLRRHHRDLPRPRRAGRDSAASPASPARASVDTTRDGRPRATRRLSSEILRRIESGVARSVSPRSLGSCRAHNLH